MQRPTVWNGAGRCSRVSERDKMAMTAPTGTVMFCPVTGYPPALHWSAGRSRVFWPHPRRQDHQGRSTCSTSPSTSWKPKWALRTCQIQGSLRVIPARIAGEETKETAHCGVQKGAAQQCLQSARLGRCRRIAASYVENEGGAKLSRPELFRLLNDAQPGDILLLEQVYRLSRLRTGDWEKLRAQLTARRVRVVALDLPTSWMTATVSCDFVAYLSALSRAA